MDKIINCCQNLPCIKKKKKKKPLKSFKYIAREQKKIEKCLEKEEEKLRQAEEAAAYNVSTRSKLTKRQREIIAILEREGCLRCNEEYELTPCTFDMKPINERIKQQLKDEKVQKKLEKLQIKAAKRKLKRMEKTLNGLEKRRRQKIKLREEAKLELNTAFLEADLSDGEPLPEEDFVYVASTDTDESSTDESDKSSGKSPRKKKKKKKSGKSPPSLEKKADDKTKADDKKKATHKKKKRIKKKTKK